MQLVPKYIIFLILFSFFYSCKKDEAIKSNFRNTTISESDNKDFKSDFNFLPTSTTNQVVVHNYYTLSYHEKYEQAEWVAYRLDGKSNSTKFDRPFFIEDPLVKTNSADWRNYRKSGYDKGHLCPAGDMKQSKSAFDDTFYTSNISPQTHDFNEGIWNKLEQKTRYWASKYNGIYVVTGGVLEYNLETIGTENVAVPKYFYKVLLHKSGNAVKMIGFLVPHQDSDAQLTTFVVSVDSIEKMTGIDFYPDLEDGLESSLEKTADYKAWSF